MKMNEFIGGIAEVVRNLKELDLLIPNPLYTCISNGDNKYYFQITLTFHDEDEGNLCLRMIQELNNNDFEMKISMLLILLILMEIPVIFYV